MSDFATQGGTGQGPVVTPVGGGGTGLSGFATVTTADIELWVDPTNGNDNNLGTQASPLKTQAEARRRCADIVDHNILVHVASGTDSQPVGGVLWNIWVRKGTLTVYADNVWDPAVFTTLLSGVAQAGTTTSQLVTGGGLVVDAYRGAFIEDGNGNRVICNGNDATTVRFAYPIAGFAPGSSYTLFSADGSILELPDGGPTIGDYNLVCGPGVQTQDTDFENSGRITFAGFKIQAANKAGSYGYCNFKGCGVSLYGCQLGDIYGVGGQDATLLCGTTGNLAGFIASIVQPWVGWGLPFVPTTFPGMDFKGYIVTTTAAGIQQHGGKIVMLGGRTAGFNFVESADEYYQMLSLANALLGGTPIELDDNALSAFAALLQGPGLYTWQDVLAPALTQPVLVDSPASVLRIFAGSSTVKRTVAGATVFNVRNGGAMYFRGSPASLSNSTGGTPQNDWTCDGVAFDPVAYFNTAPKSYVGVYGSLIIRAS